MPKLSAGKIPPLEEHLSPPLNFESGAAFGVNVYKSIFFIAMTKAAMENATMAMAVELAKHKVCHIVRYILASFRVRLPIAAILHISFHTRLRKQKYCI